MADEGYTMKEMVREMRETQKEDSARLIRMLEHSENVDQHLLQLNSKVATNIKNIRRNEKDISHFKTVSTTIASVGGVVWAVITFIIR